MGLIMFAIGLFLFSGLLFLIFWYSASLSTRK